MAPASPSPVDGLRQLLDGYVACARQPSIPVEDADRKGVYEELLDAFQMIHGKAERKERGEAQRLVRDFRPLLDGFVAELKRHWERQRKAADGFNVLAVFGLESDEIRHSKALAWLLNRDPRKKGTHYQGSLGFQAFLKCFGLGPGYADQLYEVETETVEGESRLDIRIMSRRSFLIGIEVKIWAGEGHKQTRREWEGLSARASREGIGRVHAFFLTPEGTGAGKKDFTSITWRQIADVFKAFADKAEPADVKLFARHCARAMEGFTPGQVGTKEE